VVDVAKREDRLLDKISQLVTERDDARAEVKALREELRAAMDAAIAS
jgi:peptidoglycan hydrolase CwlO-like protein